MQNNDFEDLDEEQSKIFTIKTQVGKEHNTADLLNSRADKSKLEIPSILVTPELRGYIFVEGFDEELLKNTFKTISYARNMLDGDIPIEQIEHFLTPASAVAKITEGDTVEMVAGPFRGEKAKITHIDYSKEEITVELLDSMVPIPITVRGEQVRIIKRKKEEENNKKKE
ncbi:MAG: transcription elongation factor Spt5 [Atribacterota bacterium]